MICLNGQWEIGIDRVYGGVAQVPGLPFPANEINEGYVWYRRDIALPDGNWKWATLDLKGARFYPEVYVNGEKVSQAVGGMTLTQHLLAHESVRPGNTITIEICLTPLDKVPRTDASVVSEADLWRSNLSSHLWDDVVLRVHGDVRVDEIVPIYHKEDDTLVIRYRTQLFDDVELPVTFRLLDGDRVIGECVSTSDRDEISMTLVGAYELWSGQNPKLYELECVADGERIVQSVGLKYFEIDDKKFKLNDEPVSMRMSTVVWGRFLRQKEAADVAFDEAWFEEHIVKRMMALGANTLRFHLCLPPERLLDLCDRYGLMVQAEWCFFHELDAEEENMAAQWLTWAAVAAKHPSVCVFHPWNEVNTKKTEYGLRVSRRIKDRYPELVVSHHDVIHVHAYWWSLFENLGLYYDGPEDFDKPVLADEFGGNYIDQEGNEGLYPNVSECFERFLGKDRTKEDTLWLQTMANVRVAEYWRRLGVAGYSPYCALGSPEDGDTHFFGDLRNPTPKPVWDALSASYQPIAASMNVWDRNFTPGQQVEVPIHVFNDTGTPTKVEVVCGIHKDGARGCIAEGCDGESQYQYILQCEVPAYSQVIHKVPYKMPDCRGGYRMYAKCGKAESVWDVNVMSVTCAPCNQTVGLLPEEKECINFCREYNIPYTHDLDKADVILGLKVTNVSEKRTRLLVQAQKGKKVILLGAGPQVANAKTDSTFAITAKYSLGALEEWELPEDIRAVFLPVIEGESHVHPADRKDGLWKNIPDKTTWLWNGQRGGLIVPAVEMNIENASGDAFLELWKSRGADIERIKAGSYFAYSCIGIYEFAESENEQTEAKLMKQAHHIVDDAPAIAERAGELKAKVEDLHQLYMELKGKQVKYTPLIVAGKFLARVPMVQLTLPKGELVISQMMFEGRLCGDEKEVYGLRRDPVAIQLLLNLLREEDKTA